MFLMHKQDLSAGILLVKDRKPSEPFEDIEFSTPKVEGAEKESDEQECAPPEPFEYTE